MNVSETVQHIWWATPRCGSRALSEVLQYYDFFNYNISNTLTPESDIRNVAHNHGYDVPEKYKDYKIIMQIRNPYSRAVSFWHLYNFKRKDNDELVVERDFEEYVINSSIMDSYEEPAATYKPCLFIRYENFAEDVKKIPFLDLNDPKVKFSYDNTIIKNKYKYEGVDDPRGDIRRDNIDDRFADWRSYYRFNQRLADIVYEKFKGQFEPFGYSRDSWKK